MWIGFYNPKNGIIGEVEYVTYEKSNGARWHSAVDFAKTYLRNRADCSTDFRFLLMDSGRLTVERANYLIHKQLTRAEVYELRRFD